MQLLAGIHQSELWQQLAVNCQLPIIKIYNDELDAEHPSALLQSCISPPELQLLLQRKTKQQSQLQIALCFDAPELVIARLLQQGSSLSEALANWQQQTTALLQLQQQYRRQLQLLQTDGLLQNPAAAPAWLAQAISEFELLDGSSPDLYVLLAAQALRQDLQANQLWQRLIACSLPLSEQTSLFLDLPGMQRQLTDNSKADALQNQLNASNDERDLLLQQLLHVQQELEQLFQKKQDVKQQYSQLEQDYRTEVADLTAKLQNGEQTVEKTAEQLHKFQDELNRITSAHNQTLQQQSASNDERELQLQQLMHVQQELEHYYLQTKQLQSEIHKYKSEIVQYTANNNLQVQVVQTLTEKNQSFELKIAALKQQQQHDKQTIKLLEKSLSTAETKLAQLQSRTIEESAKYKHSIRELEQQVAASITQADNFLLENARLKNQKLADQLTFEHKLLSSEQSQNETLTKLKVLESRFTAEVTQLNTTLSQLKKSEQQALDHVKQLTNQQWREHQAAVSVQKKLERELQRQQKLLAQQKADMNSMRMQLISAEQQLQAITGSRLWRTVAPVRSLSSKFQKPAAMAKEQLQRDTALILTSDFFDLDWYLKTYQDVAQSGLNPAEHYLKYGAAEGRYPGPLFDGNWYLQRYPDVADAGLNPLLHFIKFGQPEGRTASPKLLADSSAQHTQDQPCKVKKAAKQPASQSEKRPATKARVK